MGDEVLEECPRIREVGGPVSVGCAPLLQTIFGWAEIVGINGFLAGQPGRVYIWT